MAQHTRINLEGGGSATLPSNIDRPAVREVWDRLQRMNEERRVAFAARDAAARAISGAEAKDNKETVKAIRAGKKPADLTAHADRAQRELREAQLTLTGYNGALREVYGELVGVIRTEREQWRAELLQQATRARDSMASATRALEVATSEWSAAGGLLEMLKLGSDPTVRSAAATAEAGEAVEKARAAVGKVSGRLREL